MKFLLTTILLISFVSLAIFGATLMNHSMAGGTDCVASIMTGGLCPTGEIQLFIHHLGAVQVFSTAVIPLSFTLLFLTLLLFVFVGLLSFGKNPHLFLSLFLFRRLRKTRLNYRNRTLLGWLSLFELSPSF